MVCDGRTCCNAAAMFIGTFWHNRLIGHKTNRPYANSLSVALFTQCWASNVRLMNVVVLSPDTHLSDPGSRLLPAFLSNLSCKTVKHLKHTAGVLRLHLQPVAETLDYLGMLGINWPRRTLQDYASRVLQSLAKLCKAAPWGHGPESAVSWRKKGSPVCMFWNGINISKRCIVSRRDALPQVKETLSPLSLSYK